ncbi:MAG: transglycosylase SLT domain-containing protein [Candidatus Binatia bacterium]
MSQGPGVVGVVVRLLVIGVSATAVTMVLRSGRPGRTGEAVLEPAAPGAVVRRAEIGARRSWLLRAGGWYIRVDGADIAIPSLREQTASRPRASLALSISPFDHLIVHHARAEGFDWRLIAALIFEESRFDPTSRSERGAVGLMQVRPIAAAAVGAQRFQTPDDNVKVGVRYLRQLQEMFPAAEGRDRLSLVLAAYNMGPGHVRDAQTLARRYGYDPNRWLDAMALMLPLLEQPAIYTHLPAGYGKGRETVKYVERILRRYEQYKQQTVDAPAVNADALSSSQGAAANG